MRVPYSIIFGFIAASRAWPTPFPDGNLNTDFAPGSNLKRNPSEVISQLQQLIEKTCHNACLELFPDEGANHEACMSICHHKQSDSDNTSPGSGM
ncbi:hypothetical protein F5Y00DRAFT_246318 [Daldinia vernicosa]|uniref:uncharacterized protein n=1 Tax=Daldinia vernicosa TaxID=114800 RepID=UPI002007654C|nr:uncharacterized protein F5Y00DRAFT_246318 [Daldinia vernicosa]KAI0845479.1 hypothetical protein F5Y00DRAFT_246318 [Daldinia vernicosa]